MYRLGMAGLSLLLAMPACVGEPEPVVDTAAAIERARDALDQLDEIDENDLEARLLLRDHAAAALAELAPEELEAPEVAGLLEQIEHPVEIAGAIERIEAPRTVRIPLEPGSALYADALHCLGKNDSSDDFGESVAAGDFDGDGFEDLAVGNPEQIWRDRGQSGMVFVFRGTASGLEAWFALAQEGLGANENGDHFGFALAAGDIDEDGRDDLAVGAPYEDLGAVDSGYVFVLRGVPDGLEPWHGLDQTGLGVNEAGDHFGAALAFGDFDNDGDDDLAVGLPREDSMNATNTGYVFIYRASTTGLAPWHNLHYGLPARTNGELGRVLDTGDIDGDGYDDLIAGSPGELSHRGAVYVFLSRPTGIAAGFGGVFTFPHQLRYFQRVDQTGLGANEAGDHFGYAFSMGDFNGDGRSDLAVGAPGESSFGGDVNGQLYTFSGGPDGTLHAWAAPNSVPLAPIEDGAQLGNAVFAYDMDGDGFDDLLASRNKNDDGEHLLLYRGGHTGLTHWSKFETEDLGTRNLDHAGYDAGDFDGDGRLDLVLGDYLAEGGGAVFVWRGTSGLPQFWTSEDEEQPGCVPAWPGPPMVSISSTTHNSITVEFLAQGEFEILRTWGSKMSSQSTSAASVTRTATGLEPDTQYCYLAEALGSGFEWSDETRVCARTKNAPPTEPEPETGKTSVWLNYQGPAPNGLASYQGKWGPNYGATMTGLRIPPVGPIDVELRFPKAGYGAQDCNDPKRVVNLQEGKQLTSAQITSIFGGTPFIQTFISACKTVPFDTKVLVEVSWEKP